MNSRALSCTLIAMSFGCVGANGQRVPHATMSGLLEASSPVHVFAMGGVGTPVGIIGVGGGLMPTDWSSLELGVGLSDSGFQAAGSLGVRLPVSNRATMGATTGVSVGRYSDEQPDWSLFENDTGSSFTKEWDTVLWSNTQLEVRYAIDDSRALRFDIGVALPIDAKAPVCHGFYDDVDCIAVALPEVIPYVGVGLEQHF